MAQNNANKADTKAVRSRWWLFTLWADKITLDAIKSKLKGYLLMRVKWKNVQRLGAYITSSYYTNQNAISNVVLDNLFKGCGSYIKGDGKVAMVKYCDKTATAYPVDDPIKFKRGVFPFEKQKPVAAADNSNSFKDLYNQVINGASVDDLMLAGPEAAWHSRRLREVEDLLLMKKWSRASGRTVQVEYHWGVSGAGKTLGVRAKYGDANIYMVSDYKHPFDNYRGEAVLVLDEYHHQFDFEFLKKLTDHGPLQLPARYENKWAGFDKIVILANYPLEEQYPDYARDYPMSWAALLRRIDKVVEYPTPLAQPEIDALVAKLNSY